MNPCKTMVLAAALAMCGNFSRAEAQTFQNYRCVDGTQFIVAFYAHDPDAYLQIDGRPLTLRKRLALSGTRYSGSGVTLKFLRAGGITIKHAGRRVTACDLI
jgi:membrane-bound inhibitor of C-type lysozyme